MKPITRNLHIIIERDGKPAEGLLLVPIGTDMVAIQDEELDSPLGGSVGSVKWVDFDIEIRGERLRFIQQLPDGDFIVVPWTEEMDD